MIALAAFSSQALVVQPGVRGMAPGHANVQMKLAPWAQPAMAAAMAAAITFSPVDAVRAIGFQPILS